MATVIRLSRQGRRNLPHYRVGVFDRRTRRDGPPIEHLGHYDPRVENDADKMVLNEERIRYWLSVGADVSETVASFLKKRGISISSQQPAPGTVAASTSEVEAAAPAEAEKGSE